MCIVFKYGVKTVKARLSTTTFLQDGRKVKLYIWCFAYVNQSVKSITKCETVTTMADKKENDRTAWNWI